MPANAKIFFDTNVLVYQFDQTAPAKQKHAVELIEQCILAGRAVISSQVVQEFMSVALNKFKVKLSPKELQAVIDDLLKPLCMHLPSLAFYERALTLHATNSVNFYDALIIQAALDLHCGTLYSEDLQHGRHIGTLKIVNPFV